VLQRARDVGACAAGSGLTPTTGAASGALGDHSCGTAGNTGHPKYSAGTGPMF